MNISQKLILIQKTLGLTQTKLAARIGVSFATLNSWRIGKSNPRPQMQALIDELFLEVTGKKIIPEDELSAKKQILRKKSEEHKNVIVEILDNPDTRDQFILKLTYHSNSIEGSTLTEQDTAAILFDNVALSDKSLIEQMEAKNHQTALNYLFHHLSKKEKIDENLALKLHSILMNGICSDAGIYRSHGVRIIGVSLPTANYASVPKLIKEIMLLLDEKNKDIVALSADFHSRFEQIHPFSDGNGRVGRLLMNAMFLQANFAPAVIHQQQKQAYYTYLYKAQIKEDMNQLEDFLCEAVLSGFKILERSDTEGE